MFLKYIREKHYLIYFKAQVHAKVFNLNLTRFFVWLEFLLMMLEKLKSKNLNKDYHLVTVYYIMLYNTVLQTASVHSDANTGNVPDRNPVHRRTPESRVMDLLSVYATLAGKCVSSYLCMFTLFTQLVYTHRYQGLQRYCRWILVCHSHGPHNIRTWR